MWQNCFVCFGIFRVAPEKAFNEINWDLLGWRDFAVSPDFPISQSSSSSLAGWACGSIWEKSADSKVKQTTFRALTLKINIEFHRVSHSTSDDDNVDSFFFLLSLPSPSSLTWFNARQHENLIQLYFLFSSFFALCSTSTLIHSFLEIFSLVLARLPREERSTKWNPRALSVVSCGLSMLEVMKSQIVGILQFGFNFSHHVRTRWHAGDMRRRQWRWWHDDGKWQKLMIDSHNERQWAKTKKNNTSQTQKQQWNQCCVRSEVVSGVSELYTIAKEQKREAEHGEKRCDFLFHRTARARELYVNWGEGANEKKLQCGELSCSWISLFAASVNSLKININSFYFSFFRCYTGSFIWVSCSNSIFLKARVVKWIYICATFLSIVGISCCANFSSLFHPLHKFEILLPFYPAYIRIVWAGLVLRLRQISNSN